VLFKDADSDRLLDKYGALVEWWVKKVKVKETRNRPGVAQRVQEV
jgi:hypothetical protein